DAVEVVPRGHDVDADHLVDPGLGDELAGMVRREVTGDSGHEHDSTHPRPHRRRRSSTGLPRPEAGPARSSGGCEVPCEMPTVRSRSPTAHRRRSLAETTTLDARLLQQLAVLLLGHALAALLD